MMQLAILKTDSVRAQWVAQFGEYADMFMALLTPLDAQLTFKVYDVAAGHYPADIDAADAYLITGSQCSVYEQQPWIIALAAFVQRLHAKRKKLVGICFGHQLVAQALGGAVAKSPRGWGVGLHTHRFVARPAWHDQGAADLKILVSHQDQVVQCADNAVVLAGSHFCPHAVCQLGEHILTLQGHPEFVSDYARVLLQFRQARIGEPTYSAALASLHGSHEGPRVAQWLLNFLHGRHHRAQA